MSAVKIDLQSTDDVRDAIHQAVEALSAGQIVAVPTETVYGLAASALLPDAVERMFDIKGRSKDQPLAYAVKSLDCGAGLCSGHVAARKTTCATLLAGASDPGRRWAPSG